MASKERQNTKTNRGWHGDKKRHSEAAKLGHERKLAKLADINIHEAKIINEVTRKKQDRDRDVKTRSKNVLKPGDKRVNYWAKHPGHYDVEDVDTPGSTPFEPTPSVVQGGFSLTKQKRKHKGK